MGNKINLYLFRAKIELLDNIQSHLEDRFGSIEGEPVQVAASTILSPREWPMDQAELAAFGTAHMEKLTEHFKVTKCISRPKMKYLCTLI